ncbi:exo-alpha-sialidase [Ruficoccus amylovorans]|uniref:Exo-alpha-sialidase n=1 Tax=Ruficoccus amylovorans TaxID=1804625 RepID=A0A842HBF2_9BACT|nr:sialidase family protein [Ruficoccus amylovorans]MBC2593479.1 exo-alpha-sialidase [Ruficoccus amylovorans]
MPRYFQYTTTLAYLLCACVPAFSQAEESATLIQSYEATSLPSEQGWVQQVADGDTLELTPDGLHIKRAKASGWNAFTSASFRAPLARAERIDVMARMRTVTASQPGVASLALSDGFHEEFITFFPDRVYFHRLKRTVPVDMTGSAHEVDLVLADGHLSVSVDGNPLLAGSPSLPGYAMRTPWVTFGAVTGGGTGESYWEEVDVMMEPAPEDSLDMPPSVTNAESVEIYHQPGIFALFPQMMRAEDGSLYIKAPLRRTSSHMEAGPSALILRSNDEGKTWEPAERYPVLPAWKTGEHSYVRVGAVGWRYSTDQQLLKKLKAEGVEVRVTPDNPNKYAYASGYFIDRSTDGGATWKQETANIPGYALLMNYYEALNTVRVNDQTLLRGIYGKPNASKPYYESGVLRSTDNGATWEFIPIYSDPEQKLGFGETAFAKAANGDIVAMLRQEPANARAGLWVSRSSDGARTWTKPESTPMVGHPASLTLLRDGSLLCTYGYRSSPMGVRVALSRDNGKTWHQEDIRTLRADGYGGGGDNGYPTTLQMEDGSLLTVCYLTDLQGVAYIAGTRWRWDD